jgi:ketosteroid isomerase-like protein
VTAPAAERNVETVRRVLEALNEDWRKAIDEILDQVATSDFEWYGGGTGPGGPEANAVYRGREGAHRYWTELDDAWGGSPTYEILEIRPLGEGVVIALCRAQMEGEQSGIAFEAELGLVWRMRDGRIAGGRTFLAHAEAEAEAKRLAQEVTSA